MRSWAILLLSLVGTFIIDQSIKQMFLDGYYYASSCIDFELHFNKGVAFSMFAFLGDYLKWLQLLMVLLLIVIAFKEKFLSNYPLAMGFLLGGAIGNLYDRFTHGAVVDYVAWHCGFRFAVFNYADIAIDLAVAFIAFSLFLKSRKDKSR